MRRGGGLQQLGACCFVLLHQSRHSAAATPPLWCSPVLQLCVKYGSEFITSYSRQSLRSTHPLSFPTFHWRRNANLRSRPNFRFRFLVTWSSPYDCDVYSHQLWCKYLYPIWIYWHYRKFNMATAAILDFHVKWIWHLIFLLFRLESPMPSEFRGEIRPLGGWQNVISHLRRNHLLFDRL